MKLVAAVRRPGGMYNDVQVGSRVFIQMPGDHVLSGTLELYGRHEHYTSEIMFFHVQLPHISLTADLQPFPIQRGGNSNRVNGYRCFIPISGHRVLSALLVPHGVIEHDPHRAVVAIRLPMENNIIYSGELRIVIGEGPAWIRRHL